MDAFYSLLHKFFGALFNLKDRGCIVALPIYSSSAKLKIYERSNFLDVHCNYCNDAFGCFSICVRCQIGDDRLKVFLFYP